MVGARGPMIAVVYTAAQIPRFLALGCLEHVQRTVLDPFFRR